MYRELTRTRMGTQASHIDKLARAWPGYVDTWARYGLELQGKHIWMHDGGWTPYPFVLMYLLTGKGGTVTMWEGQLGDQYAAKAVEFGLKQKFGNRVIAAEMLDKLRSLEGAPASDLVQALGGQLVRTARVLPILPEESVDLAITGGVLEHFRPSELEAFLTRSRSILRTGGWASHVFDMRDHLYHADKSIPFLNHLRHSDAKYALLYGHRLGYHNRMLPEEVRATVEAAGFQIVAMRRRVLPMEKYAESPQDFEGALVGVERSQLAPRFRSASDEDLRTVAVQFICRAK